MTMIDCRLRAVLIRGLLLLLGLLIVPDTVHAAPSWKSRWRSVQWNLTRIIRPTDPVEDGVSLISVAGARKRELRHIMKTFPPPCREDLHGVWIGLNRGVGPALLGISQFAKEFWTIDTNPHGDNITMIQCDPEHWGCACAWKPQLDAGALDRHGNYRVIRSRCRLPFRDAVELDYSLAPNGRSPERFIVDQLVQIDGNHLLGFAMVQLGKLRIGGFYFVLRRVH